MQSKRELSLGAVSSLLCQFVLDYKQIANQSKHLNVISKKYERIQKNEKIRIENVSQ